MKNKDDSVKGRACAGKFTGNFIYLISFNSANRTLSWVFVFRWTEKDIEPEQSDKHLPKAISLVAVEGLKSSFA
jgi:hypothetical protein